MGNNSLGKLQMLISTLLRLLCQIIAVSMKYSREDYPVLLSMEMIAINLLFICSYVVDAWLYTPVE